MEKLLFEVKSRNPIIRIFLILLLAFCIYIACEIGRLAGLPIEGLNISIIWPAAGISLAAILLYGQRVWPGILLGCLLYNVPHLLTSSSTFLLPVLIGTCISIASTLQAIVGGFLIRHLSTPGVFNNLKDIFVFLVPVTCITQLIASSLSVPLLLLGGYIDSVHAAFIWLTFWIGDATGVLIFTPFLVVWSTNRKWSMVKGKLLEIKGKLLEALCLTIIYSFLMYSTFFLDYPLTHFIIPLILLITFRFGKRGATLALFVTAIIAIVTAVMGYGVFLHLKLTYPITILISFIDVVAATALILAGALSEREDAWELLLNYNKNLEDTINIRTKQLNEIHDTFNVKQKLISLGMLTAGIGHEIKNPLNKINEFIQGCQDCLVVLQTTFNQRKNQLDPATSVAMENTLETLQNCVQQIGVYETQANKIVDDIIQTAASDRISSTEIKTINLHLLINKTLEQIKHDLDGRYPNHEIEIKKEYSQSIGMIEGIPEDLSRVFTQVIENSLYALKQKRDKNGDSFQPILIIRTVDKREKVEIDIYDNGVGIPSEVLAKIFQPFFTTKPSGVGSGLGLAIIHDIVVQEHQGKISVDSKAGEYTEIKIILPKTHLPS